MSSVVVFIVWWPDHIAPIQRQKFELISAFIEVSLYSTGTDGLIVEIA